MVWPRLFIIFVRLLPLKLHFIPLEWIPLAYLLLNTPWMWWRWKKSKLLKLCTKQRIYFGCALWEAYFLLRLCNNQGSIFVVPFGRLLSCLPAWYLWLWRFGYIFVVPFGRILSCLPYWCFWLKIFEVASNLVLSLELNLLLFDISKILQVPLYFPSSVVIPFIVESDFRTQKKWNHHMNVKIFSLLFYLPRFLNMVVTTWPSGLFLCRGRIFYFVSLIFYLLCQNHLFPKM